MHIHGNILCRGPRAFATRVSCLIVGIWAQLKRLIIRVKIPQRPWPKGKSFCYSFAPSFWAKVGKSPRSPRCKTRIWTDAKQLQLRGLSTIIAVCLRAKNQQRPPAKTEERKQKPGQNQEQGPPHTWPTTALRKIPLARGKPRKRLGLSLSLSRDSSFSAANRRRSGVNMRKYYVYAAFATARCAKM